MANHTSFVECKNEERERLAEIQCSCSCNNRMILSVSKQASFLSLLSLSFFWENYCTVYFDVGF